MRGVCVRKTYTVVVFRGDGKNQSFVWGWPNDTVYMYAVFLYKTYTVAVFRGEGKNQSFVWRWPKLAWGSPRKVLLSGDVPTQDFFEWGLHGADLRWSVRQGCIQVDSTTSGSNVE